MPRVVRTIDTFYEAVGPFAVDRELAETLVETTYSILSRYTGKMA
ncbi:MAG TPA: hypothetical protein VLG92_05295 [Candidatus Saccharimonadia bacterium]|nr:hypothetical protein [Candidatus Saccharimonadia bacterium]